MTPWPVALFVSLFLVMFSVSMLAFAIYIEVLLVVRLVASPLHPTEFIGSLLTAAVAGPFAYIVGSGALQLGAKIIDGWILRLT